MSPTNGDTRSWPDLAVSLYDRLTGRGASITYEFDQMEIMVPSYAGEESASALWKLNGSLRIRTRDGATG